MHNLVLSPIDPEILINRVAEKTAQLLRAETPPQKEKELDPLDDLIPKSEVRGKFASASSLWKWEKEGKIQSYGIGGKRFYKRSELMEALQKVKKKGGKNE